MSHCWGLLFDAFKVMIIRGVSNASAKKQPKDDIIGPTLSLMTPATNLMAQSERASRLERTFVQIDSLFTV